MATKIRTYQDLVRECMEIRPAGQGPGKSNDSVPHVYIRLGMLSSEITAMGDFTNPDWPEQYRQSKSTADYYSEWAGCPTYAAAVKLLREGWPEGVEKARNRSLKLGKAVIKGQAKRYEYRPSITPRGPIRANVGAIAAGLPDTYIARHVTNDRRMGGKIVRMAINVSASGSVGPQMLEIRAAVIMALSDVLRHFGKQLEITVFDTSGYSTGKYLAEGTAKAAGEPFDATKIVFAAGHPSTLRRIFFCMNEHVPAAYRGGMGEYSYGRALSLRENFPADYERFDIVIDSDSDTGMGEWANEAKQVAWIKAMLAKQGIEIAE